MKRYKIKRETVNDILRIFFPERCTFCGELISEEEMYICSSCRKIMKPEHIRKTFFTEDNREILCFAPFVYEGSIRNEILRYKFQGKEENYRFFSALLAEELRYIDLPEIDAIAYVTMTRKRKHQRGFDQCKRLAQGLSYLTGLPNISALEKYRHTEPQHTLSAKERKVNLKGTYRLLPNVEVKGKSLLLLDDVMTTGSTFSECAGVLLKSGAKTVYCMAIASAETDHDIRIRDEDELRFG